MGADDARLGRKRGTTTLRRSAVVAGLLAGLGAWPLTAQAKDPASLRRWISIRHPGVEWVSTAALASWLAAAEAERPVLLDSRAVAEYGVSHLQGAIRVEPVSDGPVLADLRRDALVVVYCSVGYRSAAVARRLKALGYQRVYNLEGGIFQWANEGRPIYRGDEAANQVHPYDRLWGRFLAEPLRSAE